MPTFAETSKSGEIRKSQNLRLIDVFVLGPLMIYAAPLIKQPNVKNALLVAGALTIAYNGGNYLENKEKEK